MKITADTHVLVRAITEDDERQSRAAETALKKSGTGCNSDTCALRIGPGAVARL
jgi:predicted nucleic-acid-binding protein